MSYIFGRKNSCYFEELVRKIAGIILSWHKRFLIFGGQHVLIIHALQYKPMYLFSSMNPPKRVLEQIHKLFCRFFWGRNIARNGLSKGERWICFRSLHDANKALFSKLYWIFRVPTNSLWSQYMENKYSKKMHPVFVTTKGASHVWRKMINIREKVEHNIWWQIKDRSSSF